MVKNISELYYSKEKVLISEHIILFVFEVHAKKIRAHAAPHGSSETRLIKDKFIELKNSFIECLSSL